MSGRTKTIIYHVIESFVISILAGMGAIILNLKLRIISSKVEIISTLGFWEIIGIGAFCAFCIGVIFHRSCVSMVKSLKYFPFHIGIIVKAFIGIIFYSLCISYSYRIAWGRGNIDELLIFGLIGLIVAAGIAFVTGLFCERLTKRPNQRNGDADDRPIERIGDNKITSHLVVIERVLTKLLSGPRKTDGLQPNIALIGPYGSGKTSICNMTKDLYEKRVNKGENLPQMIFCRFEGWRFLSAEAAVEGLLDTGVKQILEEADASELWNIPERYVRAIKEVSGRWGWIWALLFGESKNPDILATSIGNVLLRLNLRLVIFVDDFDRIEADEGNCQQSVAKALNQLQNVPNLQYVICVGPMLSGGNLPADTKPCKDLLKLTRYQELVPEIAPEDVVRMIKEIREQIIKDTIYYFPWAEIREDADDPLSCHSYHIEFYPPYTELGLTDKLTGLIRTPRVLKAIRRESDKTWNGGLKGEINWYDFLLLNAIKAAEPGVFEWILRNSNLFIGLSSSRNVGTQDRSQQEAHNKIAQELQTQLRSCLQSKDERQYQVIHQTLCSLFPAFKERSLPSSDVYSYLSRREPEVWSQKVSLRLLIGADYLLRFFSGGVYEPDVPDQPVLQYIKKVNEKGFSVAEFQEQYLALEDKMTGILNKLVQFAGLLSSKNGYQICEALLEWISEPEHAKIWQDPDRYVDDTMPDVIEILRHARVGQVESESDEWFKRTLVRLIEKSPYTAIQFERLVQMSGFRESNGLGELLIQKLYTDFVEGDRKFIPAFSEFRYSLNDFIRAIRKYTGYEKFKTRLTEKLIAEANGDNTHVLKARIVLCLVEVTIPVDRRPIPIEEYGFNVNKSENKAKFDMDIMVSAIQGWKGVLVPDPVAAKAMDYLLRDYA